MRCDRTTCDRDRWRDLALRLLDAYERVTSRLPKLTLVEVEEQLVKEALLDCGGEQKTAAAQLGVSPRVMNYLVRTKCPHLSAYAKPPRVRRKRHEEQTLVRVRDVRRDRRVAAARQ
jgi:hypothetical protein